MVVILEIGRIGLVYMRRVVNFVPIGLLSMGQSQKFWRTMVKKSPLNFLSMLKSNTVESILAPRLSRDCARSQN